MLEKIMHYAQEYKDGKIDFLTLESAVDALLSASNDAKPIVSSRFSSMTRDEAIQYCYQHKDEYIRDFDSISEGVRQFDCLIAILEHGTIQPTDLPQYGMDY